MLKCKELRLSLVYELSCMAEDRQKLTERANLSRFSDDVYTVIIIPLIAPCLGQT